MNVTIYRLCVDGAMENSYQLLWHQICADHRSDR